MAAADHTRHALAKTLKEMAETMPISRIRVVELCRRCGVAPGEEWFAAVRKYEKDVLLKRV